MRNCRGMTLTELLFTGLIFALIGGVAFAFTQAGDQLWLRTDARLANLTEAQRAVNLLTEDLRQARQAGLTCGPGSKVAFTPVAGGDAVTYQLSGSQLLKQVGTNPPRVIASGLTAFTPSCSLSGGVVQLRLAAQVNGGDGSATLHSQVWVQNP